MNRDIHAPTAGVRADCAPALTRRAFLQVVGAAGGGLVLGLYLPGVLAGSNAAATAVFTPNAFVAIDTEGQVTLTMSFVEMGQGTYTSIPMLIAEELEVDLEVVRLVHAPANEKVYGHPLYGLQITGGSAAVRGAWEPMRRAGAAARMMLIAAAADTWQVPVDACRAQKGQVMHAPSGRTLDYGTLVAKAATLPVPADPVLKDPSQYTLIGTAVKRLDTKGKVDGTAAFGIDALVPDMKLAAVMACPVFGGKLRSVDDAAAKAVKGVRQVVALDDVVAVIADHTGAARKGLAALTIDWDEGPNADFSSQRWHDQLVEAAKETGMVAVNEGDFDAATTRGAKRIDAVYLAPPLAHTTMEPPNCTVHCRENECEIWVGTQAPARAQAFVARALGLPAEQVTIHNYLIGGGFGRRLDVDFIEQAARIATHVSGPVKVIWSREEDLRHDTYRPYFYHALSAVVDSNGMPTGLWHKIVGSSVLLRYAPQWSANGLDGDAVEGAKGPYHFASTYVEYVRHEPPAGLTTGWWRGVGPTHNVYALECFLDELALAAGKDPVAFRLALIADPRAKAVLELAAEKAEWGRTLPARSGLGVAVMEAFGSYAATVAEVVVGADGRVRITRLVTAIDCGIAVHPDGVVAQVHSGEVYGVTALLHGRITIENGRVQQSNFHDYPSLLLNEMPAIDVHIVPSQANVGGMGEVGTAVVKPAVLNAVHAATGKRLRTYPIDPVQLRVG